MGLIHLRIFPFFIYLYLTICGNGLLVQKQDWIDSPPASTTEGDVECFSEYMELWIHRMRIEGLRLWLSAVLRIQVSLASLDSLNHQLSACGFGLYKDPDRNYIFRVMYSGCFVQLEHGHYVMALNLLKRISRFGGRPRSYVMKCPVAAGAANSEYIQCDPDFIQVTRQIPVDNWNNELSWSLALRGSLVVALEDASLIQVYIDIHKPHITVQGRRNTILSPVQVLQTEGHFLPLKLVSGNYAFSMEATCPRETQYSSENTVLHIYKRRMGLTKRGSYENETLSVRSVSVNQTSAFTWSENSGFVKLIIPTALIQKTKKCADKDRNDVQQTFFRIDVMLTFKETNNKMFWTMENMSPCLDTFTPSLVTESSPSVTPKPHVTFTEERMTSVATPPHADGTEHPLLSAEASSKAPQLLSRTTEEVFSETFKPMQVFPATQGLREPSVFPQSSSSPETVTVQVLNSTDPLLTNRGKSNERVTEMVNTPSRAWAAFSTGYRKHGRAHFAPTTSSYVSKEANVVLDVAPLPSLHDSSLNTRETPSITSAGPFYSTAAYKVSTVSTESVQSQYRVSTDADSHISKTTHSSATPHHGKADTLVKWNLVTALLHLQNTSLSPLELKETHRAVQSSGDRAGADAIHTEQKAWAQDTTSACFPSAGQNSSLLSNGTLPYKETPRTTQNC